MTQNFLQKFFDRSKTQSQTIALRILSRQGEFFIPNWQLRSKAKHFALGLLHHGFQKGERALLIANHHPDFIFTELGSLLIGMETLCPAPSQGPERLKATLESFHPSLLYAGGPMPASWQKILGQWKNFRLVINPPSHWGVEPRQKTFRDIFNQGIIHERDNHSQYRQHLERERDQDLICPAGAMDPSPWSPLNYASVDYLDKNFSEDLSRSKFKRMVLQLDLSQPEQRLLGLYWPMDSGKEAIWLSPGMAPEEALKRFLPRFACLPASALERMAAELALAPKLGRFFSWWKKNPWHNRVGKRLDLVWLTGTPSQELMNDPDLTFKLRSFPPPPEKNFPLVKNGCLG